MVAGWKQSAARVAYHEVGHAVVDRVCLGMCSDCLLTEVDGQYIGQAEPLNLTTPFAEMDRQTAIHYLAGLFGGWAAVHLAITKGQLPEEPQGVEAVPGDRGFFGDATSDDARIKSIAKIVEPAHPEQFAEEARQLALETLLPRLAQVEALAGQLEGMGMLSPAEIEEVLGI